MEMFYYFQALVYWINIIQGEMHSCFLFNDQNIVKLKLSDYHTFQRLTDNYQEDISFLYIQAPACLINTCVCLNM
jgi:hypothetical protein